MSIHYKKTSEHKVLRDPVHGYINVEDAVIWELIDSKEFQRLRRIHQLGGTFQVYHTAEHSRFGHSLGVYEVARLMIENVKGLKIALSETERVAVLCAALLHDVGHGPFSHSFESVTSVNHEAYTDKIILESSSEIHQILHRADGNLPQMVADIISHRHKRELLTQIISSQLDADRMDYLLRDSYFTGVSYGEFDLFRILRTLRVVDDELVVKESGIHAVEDYIMARYQMYWQVYLHPTSRAYESILHMIFKRLKDVAFEKPEILNMLPLFKNLLLNDEVSVEDHFYLDETTCMYGFMMLMNSEDEVLRDLTTRLVNRDLFKYQDVESEAMIESISTEVESKGYNPRYYVVMDYMTQILYKPYDEHEGPKPIRVLKNQELVELSSASQIVKGFVLQEDKEDFKVFYPE
ncbi:phosphohydrolase [Erysipelothrix larvae]|uniref:Phosphohydrolase n=1 Tax=Erysipelothrix larvae TaxID=1514105 RepID=A0A109UHP7_9FIRM|nr:HD domain-containing protein [Erysipelothrix larvae]AMC94528.1 phosphohydrolase [Erysipelothrix larvae]